MSQPIPSISTPISTLGHTIQLGGAPPEKAAPTGTVTFNDKDRLPYYTIDKGMAENRKSKINYKILLILLLKIFPDHEVVISNLIDQKLRSCL